MVATVSLAKRMPAWFLTHGGGPLPLLGERSHADMIENWKHLAASLPAKPKSILLVSAHHEEQIPTVTTALHPPMLYDYSNFPPETYKIKYPAPGNPELAAQVRQLLKAAGVESKEDASRGFDHGAFVPLMLIFPAADIPVVQLSILSSLDPKKHIEMGEAISGLRDEGVLIVSSGASFHNSSAFKQGAYRGESAQKSQEFDDWLRDTLAGSHSEQERKDKFINWLDAPSGRFSHPREEHLIPAHVAFGSGHGSRANVIFQGSVLGAACSSFAW